MNWTDPYHGITHCGTPDIKKRARWATVTEYSTSSILSTWTSGDGFSPPQYSFYGQSHLKDAKLAGEDWIKNAKEPTESEKVLKH